MSDKANKKIVAWNQWMSSKFWHSEPWSASQWCFLTLCLWTAFQLGLTALIETFLSAFERELIARGAKHLLEQGDGLGTVGK
jgi:hypothetical protein